MSNKHRRLRHCGLDPQSPRIRFLALILTIAMLGSSMFTFTAAMPADIAATVAGNLDYTPPDAPDAPNPPNPPDAPNLPPDYDSGGDDDFVPGEVLAAADSLEHAQAIAAACHLELKSYAYGIAVLVAPDPEQAVAQSGMMRRGGMPALGLNWIYTLYDTPPTPPTPAPRTPHASPTPPVMRDGTYYHGADDAPIAAYDDPGNPAVIDMDRWQHEVMDNDRAWNLSTGAGVTVAVIDTGIDIYHPTFEGRILPNSFNSDTIDVGLAYVQDDYGHGTHVSGIIAAAPTDFYDLSGVAPDARIMAIKANMQSDPGYFESASLLRGINYAVANGAQIINMSFGREYTDGPDTLEHSTIANAVAAGVTIVAAAGNESQNHAGYPAAYPEVIAVSALRMNQTKPVFDSSYSNYGPEIDISAPGTDILATTPGNCGYMSGTSMASPNVAGAAALVKSLNPGFTPQQIRDRLNSTARQAGLLGGDLRYGHGIVSSYAALLGAGDLHSVTYNFGNSRDPVAVLAAPGATLIEPARYALGDKILMNWSTSPNGPLYDFDSPVTASMSLYANWVEVEIVGSWVDEFPDANFRHPVQRMLEDADGITRADSAPMNTIDTLLLATIEELTIRGREGSEIWDMTGLKYFPNLMFLDLDSYGWGIDGGHLYASLDLSDNPKLQWLDVSNNVNLRIINVTNNPYLTSLYAFQCRNLEYLDLSNNPLLENLFLAGPPIVDGLDVSHNPLLSFLRVDWGYIRMTELDLSNNPMLEELSITSQDITELDLSHNPLLRVVLLMWNGLESMDFSCNPELTSLDVRGNYLTLLNISQNAKLLLLDASENRLTSIDVSNSHDLVAIDVSGNQLAALDVSNNPELGQLIVSNNRIEALDLSNAAALGSESRVDTSEYSYSIYPGLLWADGNMLTSLDISNTAPNWNAPAWDGLVRLNLSGNRIPGISSIVGWQGRGLVLEDNFIFDPQNVSSPPFIATETLPNGRVGTVYNQRLIATGGGISWSIVSGRLPDGLTLGSVGALSGMPLEDGTFVFTVAASNYAGSASVVLTLTVDYAPIDGVVTWITTAEELAAIGGWGSRDRYFALANDIYLVEEWVPISGFSGILDGRGHAVHNLYVLESSGRIAAGLFGELPYRSDVTIKNLGVHIGPQGVTAIAPMTFDTYAGGLVGRAGCTSLTVINCYVDGDVFAGYGGYSGAFGQAAGGLIGGSLDARITISTSYAAGNVAIPGGLFMTSAGGLVGRAAEQPLTISNSYATGDIAANGDRVSCGGLVGAGDVVTIVSSYATGNVSALWGIAGGIAGNTFRVSERSTYRLSTQDITGHEVNELGTPLSGAQMRQQASFVGWDFSRVWAMDDIYNDGLPYLKALRKLAGSDGEKLAEAIGYITWARIRGGNNQPDSVRTDLAALPSVGLYGASIRWESSDTAVVSDAGSVTRPANGSGDAAVTLRATVTINGLSGIVEFRLIVKELFIARVMPKLISTGYGHSLAIKVDGSLWAWGENFSGQLGDGGIMSICLEPKKIMDGAVSVAGGQEHTLAIKSDGSLWAWGDNSYGQLGDGTTDRSLTPKKIMDDVAGIAAGGLHSLAIKSDGSLWAWGSNYYGRLGDGTTHQRLKPVKVLDDVVSVSAGAWHTVALKSDGSLWAWGENGGKLGDGTDMGSLVPKRIMENVVSADLGHHHSVAVTADGGLWVWGDNYYGQLGIPTATTEYSPVKLMDGVSAAAAGCYYTMAVKTDGSLWAWGDNDVGQLGDGTRIDRYEPVRIMGGAALVSASFYSIAAKTDGSLWAWGRNYFGQLGDGSQDTSLVPVQIMPAGSIFPYTPGVAVTGMVRSYNPGNPATIRLVGESGAYETVIAPPPAPGSGQQTRSFRFENVAPGTYTLVVTKPGHTSYTVRNVVVGASDADLTQDSRPDVRLMALLCGDMNGDGMINDADLTMLWRIDNYNKSAASAANPLCDLNGDGIVNDADLTILWMTSNYNKGAVVVG